MKKQQLHKNKDKSLKSIVQSSPNLEKIESI